MSVKDLLPGQPVTSDGRAGSFVLIEIIQRQNRMIRDLEARVKALEP
tara:strand:+ start:570 stop:710 length:141 start_codon:yes stop_codon:yes gene_type:complete